MEQQLKDAMRARHTVRKYKDQVLPDDIRTSLENRASELNGKLGLAIRLISSDHAVYPVSWMWAHGSPAQTFMRTS